jgi:hypothetical protein
LLTRNQVGEIVSPDRRHHARDENQKPKTKRKMKMINAIKKLNKAGFQISEKNDIFYAKKEGCENIIEFFRSGTSEIVASIRCLHENAQDDTMSDYWAGSWCENITQAIKSATN